MSMTVTQTTDTFCQQLWEEQEKENKKNGLLVRENGGNPSPSPSRTVIDRQGNIIPADGTVEKTDCCCKCTIM